MVVKYFIVPVLKAPPRKRKAPSLDEEALKALWKTARVTRSSKLALSMAKESSDGSSGSSSPTPTPPPPAPQAQPKFISSPTPSIEVTEQSLVSKRFLDQMQEIAWENRLDRLFPTELGFMSALHKFMNDRGTPFDRAPLLGSKKGKSFFDIQCKFLILFC